MADIKWTESQDNAIDKFARDIAEDLSAKFDRLYCFDITIIFLIISIIKLAIEIYMKCKGTGHVNVFDMFQKPQMLDRLVLGRTIRTNWTEKSPKYFKRELQESIFKIGKSLSKETIAEVIP